MKINLFIINILLLITGLFLYSCEINDNYSQPSEESGVELSVTTNIETIQSQATTEAKLIETEDVLSGYVVSSDAAGNIYKNLYIVSEDGQKGLQLSINQASLYNQYPIGRKVYIKLKNLALVKQNDMVTLGELPTSTFPVDQLDPFKVNNQIILGTGNKREEELVVIVNPPETEFNISNLSDDLLNTLVEINGIEFQQPGTTFVRNNINTDNAIKGIPISNFSVRLSRFANFGAYKIPWGKGKLKGILTKFRNTYQLILRNIEDVQDFPTNQPFFYETFDEIARINDRPKIENVRGFDNKEVSYLDIHGNADIRTSGRSFPSPLLWLPQGRNASLLIQNINTQDKKRLLLVYDFNASIFSNSDVAYTDDLIIKCNDVAIQIPRVRLDITNNRNTYYRVALPIPEGTNRIEFFGSETTNKKGFRIDNIQLYENKLSL